MDGMLQMRNYRSGRTGIICYDCGEKVPKMKANGIDSLMAASYVGLNFRGSVMRGEVLRNWAKDRREVGNSNP